MIYKYLSDGSSFAIAYQKWENFFSKHNKAEILNANIDPKWIKIYPHKRLFLPNDGFSWHSPKNGPFSFPLYEKELEKKEMILLQDCINSIPELLKAYADGKTSCHLLCILFQEHLYLIGQ